MKEIRFDTAFKILVKALASESRDIRERVIIIRDLFGKLHLALPSTPEEAAMLELSLKDAWDALGVYAEYSGRHVYSSQDFFDSDKVFSDPDIVNLSTGDSGLIVKVLDRTITGQAWSRGPTKTAHPPRIAFYGLKGGVGRSTALAMTAYHFGKQGKHVLLVDFDLESPGLSGILVGKDRLPECGIVDWFVEDAVGNGGDIIQRMSVSSDLSSFPGVSGRIDVVSAFGSDAQDYVPKLSRLQIDMPKAGGVVEHFGDRARRLLEALEAQYKPDYVLLDSRAGLHDLAAVSVVGLSDYALCFGTDSPQTWDGYRLLFSYWRDRPDLLEVIREKLVMVYALMPEQEQEKKLASFVENAYSLFSDMMYQEVAADSAASFDAFNFDMGNVSAPHYPVCIKWNQGLLDFSAGKLEKGLITDSTLDMCYGSFYDRMDELIGGTA